MFFPYFFITNTLPYLLVLSSQINEKNSFFLKNMSGHTYQNLQYPNNIHQRYKHITNTAKYNMHNLKGYYTMEITFWDNTSITKRFFSLITWWVGMCPGEGGTKESHAFRKINWVLEKLWLPMFCQGGHNLTRNWSLVMRSSTKATNITFVDCHHSELHYLRI